MRVLPSREDRRAPGDAIGKRPYDLWHACLSTVAQRRRASDPGRGVQCPVGLGSTRAAQFSRWSRLESWQTTDSRLDCTKRRIRISGRRLCEVITRGGRRFV